MTRRILVFYLYLPVALTMSAQNTDFVRAGLYSDYDIRVRNAAKTQSVVLGTMTFHHKWIQDKEDDIADLQKEYHNYLVNMHDNIALAAQLYGVFYELTEISGNLKNIGKACEESPANILANAFNEEKRQIVTNIVSTTTELVFDLKKTYLEKTLMTETERIQLIDDVRTHMKWFNKQLRRIERQIRYYNLCELWNDIRNKEYVFRKKTNAIIAREARDRWQEHYKLIFSDVQRNDTSLRNIVQPY